MNGETRTRTRVPITEYGDATETWDIFYPGSCDDLPFYGSGSNSFHCLTEYVEESMTDVVTPDFHKLRDRGYIINNPMTKTTVKRTYPLLEGDSWVQRDIRTQCDGSWTWITSLYMEKHGVKYLPGDNLENEGGLFVDAPDIDSDISNAKALAINEAWANIDATELQALVSAMESGKTLNGILDTVRRVNKFLRNVKRLQLKELSKLGLTAKDRARTLRSAKKSWNSIKEEFSLSALCDRYMELRYGWRPLYYDIRGMMNALEAEFTHVRQTFRGYETVSGSVTGDPITEKWGSQSWAYFNLIGYPTTTVTASIRAGVLCEVDLSQMDPWGLTKIPESAFELMPYSFVLDWFFNFSDTIAAWTPDVGFSPLASWVSVKKTTTQSLQVSSHEDVFDDNTSSVINSGALVFSPVTYQKVTESLTREPDPARAILPRLKLRLNTAKLIDLAIMAKNLLYGGRYPLAKRSLRL